jgi:fumarate hydratase subunit beta
MNEQNTVKLPLTKDRVRNLKIGDIVYLDGEIVITAGLPTFKRIADFIKNGEQLPIDLNNAALFHLVSYNREINGKFEILYLNPTTSTRFNDYMPTVIKAFHLCAVGGKGGLGMESVKAMKETGCVYLSFLGAGSPFLSLSIREVISVSWNDLIAQYRLVKLRVEGLGPAIVSIDSHGNSLYENVMLNAEKNFTRIIDNLNPKIRRLEDVQLRNSP